MNYLLHNLGYDKPITFREIVLRTYHGKCVWLRDIYFSRLELYNYEDWLPDIQYEYNELKREQERLEKAKNELAALTDDKLQEMYSNEVSKIETMHNCQHSYHIDSAAEIKKCTDKYYTSLQKWLNIPNTPNWLTNDLVDVYDTAMRDLNEHIAEDNKSVERMHNTPIPTFEDFKSETIQRLEYNVQYQKERISSRNRNIKMVEERIAEVKQIFAWLDSIEEDAQC